MRKKKACPSCGKGELIQVNDIISEFGGYVFVEKGERCTACGEEFPYEEDSQKTIEAARRLGVWPEPLKLYRKLSKSGRTLVLRIPSDLERQMQLREETEVAITKIGNKIVIEKEEKEHKRQ
jgi:hypothetical protein